MGKAAGAVTHPGRRQHLEGQPRADATGDEGGGEQGERAEKEAEVASEHIARREQEEEDRLEPCRPTGGKPQRGAAGAEHTEHGDTLGVHAPGVELAEHRNE